MYSSYRDKRERSWGDIWIKALARVLAALIVLGLAACWEFALNPRNNTSFILEGNAVAQVDGVDCTGDELPWYLQIDEIWSSCKKGRARLAAWLGPYKPTEPQMLEIADGGQLSLNQCENEQVNVALVWDINTWSNKIHFRVHTGYVMRLEDGG